MIYKAWITALRAEPPFRKMRYKQFEREQRRIVDQVLARPRTSVLMARNPKGEEPKFGYIAYERIGELFLLHFIYVREMYRDKGIATGLLRAAGVSPGNDALTATAWTKHLGHHRKRWNLEYNPFLAWRPYE